MLFLYFDRFECLNSSSSILVDLMQCCLLFMWDVYFIYLFFLFGCGVLVEVEGPFKISGWGHCNVDYYYLN